MTSGKSGTGRKVGAAAPRRGTERLADGPQPLYARLREQLRADILEGRLLPQQRLPSESELTAAHGISRITVRQALNDLQKEGLLIKVHGKGSFVAPPRVTQDLARLRGLAESVEGSGHQVHGRLLALDDSTADAEVAQALQVETGSRVTELLSLRYLDRQPLSLNHSFVPPALGDRLRRIDFAGRDLLSVYERDFGLAIGHADLEISAGSATRLQAKHLKVAAGAPVLRLRRIVYSAQGRPLHLEMTCYRSDEFSYRVRVERPPAAGDRRRAG